MNPFEQPTRPPTARAAAPATSAAAITAAGRGAIAVIVVHGTEAQRCVLRCFEPATAIRGHAFAINAIRYGRWLGPREERGSRSGEAVVVVATAEDAVEVHCHGGRAAVAIILQDLAAAGAATIDADAMQIRTSGSAEEAAIGRLVASTCTTRTAAIALDQARGAMRHFAAEVRTMLASGNLEAAGQRIARVLRHEPLGRHLAEPWRVVLAGPPNVGKSSLMNALLGYRRAITFATPGTTRDIVSADTAVDGWPVRLSDTAGLRSTEAALEAEGVRRAQTALEEADLVLLVIDLQEGLTETHRAILARTSTPPLMVWNKCDLAEPNSPPADDQPPPTAWRLMEETAIAVSATCGTGLRALEAAISRALVPEPPAAGEPVPVTPRQRTALHRAAEATTIAECLEALEGLEP